MKIKRTVCDACDTVNPPTAENSDRLCMCCAGPDGMYTTHIPGKKAIGKTTTVYLQSPVEVRWRGLWGWRPLRKKDKVVKKRCPKCRKKMPTTKIERHLRKCRNT